MLAFWTRGFPCQDTGKENLWCPEYLNLPLLLNIRRGNYYSAKMKIILYVIILDIYNNTEILYTNVKIHSFSQMEGRAYPYIRKLS